MNKGTASEDFQTIRKKLSDTRSTKTKIGVWENRALEVFKNLGLGHSITYGTEYYRRKQTRDQPLLLVQNCFTLQKGVQYLKQRGTSHKIKRICQLPDDKRDAIFQKGWCLIFNFGCSTL